MSHACFGRAVPGTGLRFTRKCDEIAKPLEGVFPAVRSTPRGEGVERRRRRAGVGRKGRAWFRGPVPGTATDD